MSLDLTPYGAVALAGQTGAQIYSNRKANEQNAELAAKQAEWNIKQQREQNAWNLEQWMRENEYNSPEMQMARLKAAGLNPNLMYGQGTVGNAGSLRSADVKPYSRADAKSVLQGVDAFRDILSFAQTGAQVNNMEKLGRVYEQEAIRKAFDSQRIAANTDKILFDLGLSQDMRNYNLDAAEYNTRRALYEAGKSEYEAEYLGNTLGTRTERAFIETQKIAAELEKVKTSTDISKREIELKAKEVQAKLDQIAADIKGKEAATQRQIMEARLAELRANLRAEGFEIHDNLFFRWLFSNDRLKDLQENTNDTIIPNTYRHR